MSTYGSHPEQMTVKLTLGDGAHLVATSTNGWAGPVSLVWGPDDGQWTEETSTLTDVGTVDGTEVSWTLTAEQVTARAAFPYVRLVDNGMTMQAGEVIPWTGGLGTTTTQTIASLTAGPPGPTAVSADADNVAGLGSDGLIYVSPAASGAFSDAAVAAFVADTGSSTYASILAGFAATDDPRLSDARTPTAHEHTAADVDSGASSDGQVLTSDGAGGAAWETPTSGVTDHGLLSGLGDDDHTQYALADGSRGSFAAPLGSDDNYVTDAEKAALHGHSNKAALDLVSGTNTGDQDLSGYALTSSLGTAAAEDVGAFATAAQGALADSALQDADLAAHASGADHDARYVTVVEHGAVAGTARPAGATVVLWIGSVEPTNAVAGDQWDDASGSPSVYYTQDEVDALLADKADVTQAINAQTGTTYTLVAGDAGKLVTLTNGSAITLNAPGSVFTAGQRVDVLVLGAGMATIVGTSGATVNGTPTLVSRAQYSAFTVVWLSATSAVVVGDMAAA